ncbi:MAG: Na+/H+ antiporter NhaA [Acidobacteriaceae bacterium]|nr:Na+/H+ antiporter NhaA [Acidobacteriaceae bacterium]
MEAAGGIVLLACTIAALVWANSKWEQSYHGIWQTQFSIAFGKFSLTESRHQWIDDGLMSVFFFLVGMEIKREVLAGELSSLKKAAFPFIAALGGTIVPALIYILLNQGSFAQKGWGIPMATDIAFALGVLALLGARIPVALKVFVAALAIADDILAVLVIALFYTDRIHLYSLAAGLAGVALSFVANLLGVRKPAVYALIGVFIWCALLNSGVHVTVAGVLLAFTIPARTGINRARFLQKGRSVLDRLEREEFKSPDEEQAAIHALEKQLELVQSPLHRIEHRLQPWVSFFVMPLFAFSNAGVPIKGHLLAAATNPVSLGVALGLFAGKPVGVWLFAWLSAKAKLATRPEGVSWLQTFGASWLCGIGFTMSLFIATLAFRSGALLDMAKIGTLAASIAAGICGSVTLARQMRNGSTST